ncbi:uncharacterized protein [Apostichopus japonicus]|uniref:uncharacterized protein isoform X2 n=1 Tax=Stichopus japonicus TaxID=307972 RepID=UPI003AB2D1CE
MDHAVMCERSITLSSNFALFLCTFLFCPFLLCNGQQEQVRMTMLLKGHFNSDGPNTEYQCYLSDGHEGAIVESFRAVDTRNIRSPDLNPDPTDPIRTSGTYPHWKVTLDNNNNNDFGVFGCRARKQGRRNTEVTGVFMRSDAHFTPHDGLFSKTVAFGDRDVHIRMTQIGRYDDTHAPSWLKDDNTDSSQRGSLTYRIAHDIQSDDAAIYGCFRNRLRDQAKHGIQILIVRACPEGRWDLGNSCSGVCRVCYNGGICDEVTGNCICAPGFKGNNCQIACGGNRFGHTCEFRCSDTDEPNRCRHYLFCLVHPFGCRCNTGWKGLNCNEPCNRGTYGASCLQTCHCLSGQCNRYTGVCTASPRGCSSGWAGTNCQACVAGKFGTNCQHTCNCRSGECNTVTGFCTGAPTGCTNGWRGRTCQQECVAGTFGSNCDNTCHCQSRECDRFTGICTGRKTDCISGWRGSSCHEECGARTFGANCDNTCHCQSGECDKFTGICTGRTTDCMSGWRGSSCHQECGARTFGANCDNTCHCQSGECDRFTGTCTGRTTDCMSGWRGSSCHQECGARTFGANCDNTCHCQSGECDRFTGTCTGGTTDCTSGWTGSICQEALLTSAPEEVIKGSLSITISWSAWDGDTNARNQPVIGYMPYHKNSSATEWIPGSSDPVQTLNFTFSDLTPDTNYSFSVSVVIEGNKEGPKSPERVVKTTCTVPGSPNNLELVTFKGEKDRLTISWQMPSSQDIKCSSGVTQMTLYYSNNMERGSEVSEVIIDVSNTSYTLNVSLEEGEYTFQLSITTAGGESSKSQTIFHLITGFEPIVQWQSEQVTIYAEEKTAKLFLEITEPRGRDVTIGLLSNGVGLIVHDDITIPETATIPEGKYVGSVNVTLHDDAVEGSSENGYRKVRIRISEVLKGKASLGGYGYLEIIDVNILGHATSETGYHSGSFRTSRVIANEDDGSAVLTLIVNEPFDEDLVIPYRVNLEWTGTTSHARHEVDYMYQVAHHEEMGYKHAILPAGETSLDIPFQLRDDDIPEDVEQFMVQINRDSLSHRINILTDTVIVDIVDNDRCPDTPGAQYYDGSCYFKVNLPGEVVISADEAISRCNDQGGYLAIIEREVENTIVSDTADLKQAWIGAIRDPDDQDTFIWSDGSSLVFDCWRQREPNNRLGNENCVKINYVRLGFWNDTPCQSDKQVRFGVCEKPAVASDSM